MTKPLTESFASSGGRGGDTSPPGGRSTALRALVAKTQRNYERLDQVFAETRLCDASGETRDARMQWDMLSNSGVSIQILESKRMAYPKCNTAKALWDAMVEQHLKNCNEVSHVCHIVRGASGLLSNLGGSMLVSGVV